MSLSPNLVTLNVSSLNITLNSSIIESICCLILKLQAAFSRVLLGYIQRPVRAAARVCIAGSNPGGRANASTQPWVNVAPTRSLCLYLCVTALAFLSFPAVSSSAEVPEDEETVVKTGWDYFKISLYPQYPAWTTSLQWCSWYKMHCLQITSGFPVSFMLLNTAAFSLYFFF